MLGDNKFYKVGCVSVFFVIVLAGNIFAESSTSIKNPYVEERLGWHKNREGVLHILVRDS